MSFVNFDVCAIAFVMYLLNSVSFSIFALITFFIKGGESSSQFQWFTIAKIEL